MSQQPLYGLAGDPLARSEVSRHPDPRQPGKRLDFLLSVGTSWAREHCNMEEKIPAGSCFADELSRGSVAGMKAKNKRPMVEKQILLGCKNPLLQNDDLLRYGLGLFLVLNQGLFNHGWKKKPQLTGSTQCSMPLTLKSRFAGRPNQPRTMTPFE